MDKGAPLPKVTVVGLGPAGPEYLSTIARTHLQGEARTWFRTRCHPAAVGTGPEHLSFDDVYDSADRIEQVYESIVTTLLAEAEARGEIVYAVPGSPVVAETTVDLLRAQAERGAIELEIVPALSFLDLVWVRLGVDPLAAGVRLVDGRRFAVEAAGERGPLLVAQCDALWVLSDIKLAFDTDIDSATIPGTETGGPPGQGTPTSVTVLQRLGLPDEHVVTIAWEDLDRVIEPDHLTSLWIPEIRSPVAQELARVGETARHLRRLCPWDREQTHKSLGRHLVEETYELLDAIESLVDGEAGEDKGDEHLVEELGDVLFQVFAHAAIAEQEGRFTMADVARTVTDKLIERHPHVYSNAIAETSDDVATTWEINKKVEKGRASVMEGIPRHLPALAYAAKVLKKAAAAGIDLADDQGVVADTGVGGALVLLADQARRRGQDPEGELRRVTDLLRRRFEAAERAATADGIELATDPTSALPYWRAAQS